MGCAKMLPECQILFDEIKCMLKEKMSPVEFQPWVNQIEMQFIKLSNENKEYGTIIEELRTEIKRLNTSYIDMHEAIAIITAKMSSIEASSAKIDKMYDIILQKATDEANELKKVKAEPKNVWGFIAWCYTGWRLVVSIPATIVLTVIIINNLEKILILIEKIFTK